VHVSFQEIFLTEIQFLLIFLLFQVRVAGTACMSACQHIARSLMALPLADSVKQLSLPALDQLSLDVLQCER
jgi:hypothetical protein